MARNPLDQLVADGSAKLKDLQRGGSVAIAKVPEGGSLEARRMPNGQVIFYWRHTRDGKTERLTIGHHDPSASPKALEGSAKGYSLAAAWTEAGQLAKRDAATPGGIRAELEREQQAQVHARQQQQTKSTYTLMALCQAYADLLKRRGKDSHRDARNLFKNHIQKKEALATKPAADVEKREVVAAIRELTEAGHNTTARKLRAYLRAAYATALRADSDATLPAEFIRFNITANPVEAVTPIKGGRDKNPLSLAELRTYWQALQNVEDPKGAALRLQVLSGGQRVAQLVRLRDSDLTDKAFQLWDKKGKREEPRQHLLPITAPIRAELGKLCASGFLLSTDGGKTPMHSTSLSAWASKIADAAGIKAFTLKRVRSGVETELARARVPLHIRGQLQSHGLGGVQERHYDDYDYLRDKAHALDALHGLLEGKAAGNVKQLRRHSV